MIICKDEAVQISGRNKYDTMFWCMVLCVTCLRGGLKNLENAVENVCMFLLCRILNLAALALRTSPAADTCSTIDSNSINNLVVNNVRQLPTAAARSAYLKLLIAMSRRSSI
jgi:hypothetical protein